MEYQIFQSGYPGANTRTLLSRFEKEVLRHRPTSVVLQCGTNDAANPLALVPLPEFDKNIKNLLFSILSNGAKALLLTPPPCYSQEVIERYNFDLPKETDLNREIVKYAFRASAAAKKLGVRTVDLWKIFSVIGNVGNSPTSLIRNKANSGVMDGAHPTEPGHGYIGLAVYETLMEGNYDCSRLVFFGDSITYGYPYSGMGSLEGTHFPAIVKKLLDFQQETSREE